MASSVVDARTVVAVEKVLTAGAVIISRKENGLFHVIIGIPDFTVSQNGEAIFTGDELQAVYTGSAVTFPEAFNLAYRQFPAPVAA